MCTAVSLVAKNHYFGRNLDLEHSYDESVLIVPRNFELTFRQVSAPDKRYAMIGIGLVSCGYPLFFDAVNEKGLAMAGLNFPGNAKYFSPAANKDNVSPFEFIPWILCQCDTLQAARKLLERINLAEIPFSDSMPLSPLHWLISDKTGSVVVESTCQGLRVFDDPIGVLTNNPPFDYHLHNLNNYLNCTAQSPLDRFSPEFDLKIHSKGMGAIGIPGDFSSSSRFIKAAFVKGNTPAYDTETENICAFFRILQAVAMPEGTVITPEGSEKTVYACCCNTDKGIYYYSTHLNPGIMAVDMYSEDLDAEIIRQYPLAWKGEIRWVNKT